MDDRLDTLAAAEEPAEAGDLAGQVLDGRYELLQRLGAGGMGVVYAARHVVLNSRLAIKVLRPPPASHADEAIERFRREARAASALGHPNIVDVRDFGTLPGGLSYYVMEHLEGSDLLAEIERNAAMPAPRLAHIGMQVADALHAAHQQGIVHRDLKPENVFLTTRNGETDHVKLIDFGIAKVTSSDVASTLPPMGQLAMGMMPVAPSRGRFTAAGIVLGTPAYMSPEQCAGRDVDFRSDLYALGVLLFEAATGVVPFDADSVFELMRKHQQATPPDPRVLVPELPDPIAELILSCLAKDPSARPADMRAVQTVLAPFAPVIERPTAVSIANAMRASELSRGALRLSEVAAAIEPRPSQAPRTSHANDTPRRLIATEGSTPAFAVPVVASMAGPVAAPSRPSTTNPGRPSLTPQGSRWLALGLAMVGVVALGSAALLVATRPSVSSAAASASIDRTPVAVAAAPSPPSIPSMPMATVGAEAPAIEVPAVVVPAVVVPAIDAPAVGTLDARPAAPVELPRSASARRRPRPMAAPAASTPEITTPVEPTREAAPEPRHARPTDAVRDPWAD